MGIAAVAQLLVSRSRQAFCGLRGHDMMLHFEPERLSLRCLACGAETAGWRLDVNPRLRLRQPRLVAKVTVRSENAGSRRPGNRHEPDTASPAPRAA
jgi:hypothetical protein